MRERLCTRTHTHHNRACTYVTYMCSVTRALITYAHMQNLYAYMYSKYTHTKHNINITHKQTRWHEHTPTHTHTRTHTRTLSCTHSPHTQMHRLCVYTRIPNTRKLLTQHKHHTRTHTFAQTHSHTHTPTHPHTLSHAHTHTITGQRTSFVDSCTRKDRVHQIWIRHEIVRGTLI